MLDDVVSAFGDGLSYAESGVEALSGVPALLPSLWSTMPAAFTSVLIGIICVAAFAVLLQKILVH